MALLWHYYGNLWHFCKKNVCPDPVWKLSSYGARSGSHRLSQTQPLLDAQRGIRQGCSERKAITCKLLKRDFNYWLTLSLSDAWVGSPFSDAPLGDGEFKQVVTTDIYIYIYIYIYIHTYIHTICVDIHICIYIYIYICIQTSCYHAHL